MTRPANSLVAGFLLLLTATGCGGGGDLPGGEVPGLEWVESADPRLAALTAALLPEVEERSGLAALEPVRVERRSRRELVTYLGGRMDRELPRERSELLVELYSLLGLVPDTLDLRALLMQVYTEQVAGFYDPDTRTLFVLDDQGDQALQPLLVHELVHALQDQHTSLDSLTHRDRGNDRRVAAQAAIEGHATLVMLEFMTARLQGESPAAEALPDLSAQLRLPPEALAAQYPALGAAPLLLRESLLFPYSEGAGYVQALWRSEGSRVPPFGRHLPASTEQVMHPGRALGTPADPPVELRLEPPEGIRVLKENTLGSLELGLFLEERVGPGARPLSVGWGGDRYLLLEDGEGARGVAWVVVWDGVEERDRFLTALGGAVLGRFPHRTVVSPLEVEGRPASLLVTGPGGAPPAFVKLTSWEEAP